MGCSPDGTFGEMVFYLNRLSVRQEKIIKTDCIQPHTYDLIELANS